MKDNNGDAKKIVLGAVVGGLIGGALFYLLHRTDEKNPMLDKIGQAISDLSSLVEESRVDESDEAVRRIEKTIPHGDNVLNNALTWIATGINLWQKIKKGM